MINFSKLKLNKIPEYGLLFLLFLPLLVSYNFLYPYVVFKGLIFRIITEGLFFLAAVLLVKNKLYRLPKNWLVFSWPAWLIILPLTSFLGADSAISWWGNFERMEGGFYYLHLAVYFLLLVLYLRDLRLWKKFFWGIWLVSILIDFFAIAQKLGFSIISFDYSGRVGGTLGNAAYLAAVALISSMMLVYYFYQYRLSRKFFGPVIALNILVIFISATRGVILALGLVVLASLVISLLKKDFLTLRGKKFNTCLLAALVLFGSALLVFKNTPLVQKIEPLRRITSIGLNDVTTQSRILVWRYSLKAFQAKPVFGWGLDNYKTAFNKYFDGRIAEEWFDRAHNQFLDVLVAGGLVSFIPYLLAVGGIFYCLKKLYRQGKINFVVWQIFTLGSAAYLIQNFFIFDTVSNLIFFFVFLAWLIFLSAKDQAGYFTEWQFKAPRAVKTLIIVLAGTLTVVSGYWLVIRPAWAAYQAMRAFRVSVEDFSQGLPLFSRALAVTPGRLGREDILLFLFNLEKEELQTEKLDHLDATIKLLEAEPQLAFKNALDLSWLYNFKGVASPEYLDKSLELLERLKQQSPLRRRVYYNLGYIYALKGQPDKSLENFKRAMEIRKDAESLWNLVAINSHFGNNGEVVKFAKMLIEGEYVYIDERYKFKPGQIKQLIPAFDAAGENQILEKFLLDLISQDRQADYLADLAILEIRLKKYQEATEYALEAITLDPSLKEDLKEFFNF